MIHACILFLSLIQPSLVNLTALLNILRITLLIFVSSPINSHGIELLQSTIISMLLFFYGVCIIYNVINSRINTVFLHHLFRIYLFLDQKKSIRSSTMVVRRLHDNFIFSTFNLVLSKSSSLSTISLIPLIEFIGVRISWLTFAIKSSLLHSASSNSSVTLFKLLFFP